MASWLLMGVSRARWQTRHRNHRPDRAPRSARSGHVQTSKENVMRILYGIVGEGMGHATRSRVVIEHLLAQGHEVQLVSSNGAADALAKWVPAAPVHRIEGLRLIYEDNELEIARSFADNVRTLPGALRASKQAYDAVRAF